MRAVTRCARLAADVGWPEPAAVVISIDNLINSIALACTDATQAMLCILPCYVSSLMGGKRESDDGELSEDSFRNGQDPGLCALVRGLALERSPSPHPV